MKAVRSRRQFLAQVGQGMLVASVGQAAAVEIGLAPAPSNAASGADEPPETLTFGPLESLVELMQETPTDRLLPCWWQRLQTGTELRELVAAAALANARTFGGEDYVGFHTMMALAPAYHMAAELPEVRSRCRSSRSCIATTSGFGRLAAARPKCCGRSARPRSLNRRGDGAALRDAVRQ